MMISCLIMVWALIIRVHKIGPDGRVDTDEAIFIFSSTVAMLIPVLNLIASICYLCRAFRG